MLCWDYDAGRAKMISLQELEIIRAWAQACHVRKVWLFGSCLKEDQEPADIDLAAEGLEKRRFFEYYAQLADRLAKPVDLLEMSADLSLEPIIRTQGKIIYEA